MAETSSGRDLGVWHALAQTAIGCKVWRTWASLHLRGPLIPGILGAYSRWQYAWHS